MYIQYIKDASGGILRQKSTQKPKAISKIIKIESNEFAC
jgi:hypothetical protein